MQARNLKHGDMIYADERGVLHCINKYDFDGWWTLDENERQRRCSPNILCDEEMPVERRPYQNEKEAKIARVIARKYVSRIVQSVISQLKEKG